MLKQERGFSDYKLRNVINKLKSFEMDIKRREFNQLMYLPQTNIANVALISAMTSIPNYKLSKLINKLKSIEMVVAGGEGLKTTNMLQVNYYDDMEDMDFKRQMTILIVRAHCYMERIETTNMLQVDLDDTEELDLKWHISSLTLRASRFTERTGKKICNNDKIEIEQVQRKTNML